MKKLNIFGKQISVTLLTLLVIAGLVSGALLTYYGTITGKVIVEQSVLVDGMDINTGSMGITDTIPEGAPGGERFCFKHTLENKASVPATAGFETLYNPDGEGITTTIYELPAKTTLILENKDSGWQAIEDSKQATLTFDTVNPEFVWSLEATGLEVSTSYALIYYADADPRFEVWGGDNPGALIATVNSDESGVISTSGSTDLNMNLPAQPDWNINPGQEYCVAPDKYVHCEGGAKIWLVPSDVYDGINKKVTSWQPTKFLFETDLITYFDCQLGIEDYLAEIGGTAITELTINSKETSNILTCYDFAINIAPDTYTITTGIKP